MNTEQADLQARFPAPAERDLPPGRHDAHRTLLMDYTRPRTSHRGKSHTRTRALVAAAAGTAVAAAAAGYAITASNTSDTPAAASPKATTTHARTSQPTQAVLAARVLRAAAAHLDGTAAPAEPAPGQWIYDKTVSYGAPGQVQPSGVTTSEAWLTFDGSQTAYYQDGQLVTHTDPVPVPGPAAPAWAAWNADPSPKTAYDVLAVLPADPRALLAVIAREEAGQSAAGMAAGNPIAAMAPKTEAQREFDFLTLILWNAAGGVGGPPAAEAAAYRALASLPGIAVQQPIIDTAGGRAIGVSDDGGYEQLLIDPVSDQVIGLRQLSNGIGAVTINQAIASGHIDAALRKMLDSMTKAQRDRLIAASKKMHFPAYPAKGTLIQEIIYARTAEVPAPGDH